MSEPLALKQAGEPTRALSPADKDLIRDRFAEINQLAEAAGCRFVAAFDEGETTCISIVANVKDALVLSGRIVAYASADEEPQP